MKLILEFENLTKISTEEGYEYKKQSLDAYINYMKEHFKDIANIDEYADQFEATQALADYNEHMQVKVKLSKEALKIAGVETKGRAKHLKDLAKLEDAQLKSFGIPAEAIVEIRQYREEVAELERILTSDDVSVEEGILAGLKDIGKVKDTAGKIGHDIGNEIREGIESGFASGLASFAKEFEYTMDSMKDLAQSASESIMESAVDISASYSAAFFKSAIDSLIASRQMAAHAEILVAAEEVAAARILASHATGAELEMLFSDLRLAKEKANTAEKVAVNQVGAAAAAAAWSAATMGISLAIGFVLSKLMKGKDEDTWHDEQKALEKSLNQLSKAMKENTENIERNNNYLRQSMDPSFVNHPWISEIRGLFETLDDYLRDFVSNKGQTADLFVSAHGTKHKGKAKFLGNAQQAFFGALGDDFDIFFRQLMEGAVNWGDMIEKFGDVEFDIPKHGSDDFAQSIYGSGVEAGDEVTLAKFLKWFRDNTDRFTGDSRLTAMFNEYTAMIESFNLGLKRVLMDITDSIADFASDWVNIKTSYQKDIFSMEETFEFAFVGILDLARAKAKMLIEEGFLSEADTEIWRRKMSLGEGMFDIDLKNPRAIIKALEDFETVAGEGIFADFIESIIESMNTLPSVTAAIEKKYAKIRADILYDAQDNLNQLRGNFGEIANIVRDVNIQFNSWMLALQDANASIAEQTKLLGIWKDTMQESMKGPFKALRETLTSNLQDFQRRDWTESDWQSQFDLLSGEFNALDPTSESYFDNSLDILTEQSDILQEISGGIENMIEGFQNVSKSLKDMLFELRGGSLSAVQSEEIYTQRYNRLLGAALSPDATVEDIEDFESFATTYLDFMKAYSGNYDDVVRRVIGDVEGVISNIDTLMDPLLNAQNLTNSWLETMTGLLTVQLDGIISAINQIDINVDFPGFTQPVDIGSIGNPPPSGDPGDPGPGDPGPGDPPPSGGPGDPGPGDPLPGSDAYVFPTGTTTLNPNIDVTDFLNRYGASFFSTTLPNRIDNHASGMSYADMLNIIDELAEITGDNPASVLSMLEQDIASEREEPRTFVTEDGNHGWDLRYQLAPGTHRTQELARITFFEKGGYTGEETGFVHPHEWIVPTQTGDREGFLRTLNLEPGQLAQEIADAMPNSNDAPIHATMNIDGKQFGQLMVENLRNNREVRKELKRIG